MGSADMEEVGKLLPAVFRRRLRRDGAAVVDVLAPLWPQVAGKAMAQHSLPVAFEAGTLTLVTNCPSWSGQLRQMAEEIRAQINRFLGEPVVTRLRIECRDSFEPPQPAARAQQAAPPLLETKPLEVAPGGVQLDDPEMAGIVGRSLAKYFARR